MWDLKLDTEKSKGQLYVGSILYMSDQFQALGTPENKRKNIFSL